MVSLLKVYSQSEIPAVNLQAHAYALEHAYEFFKQLTKP